MLRLLFMFLLLFPVVNQDTPTPDYFVETGVDNAAPFVGQQITYQFRFYDAVGLTNNPLYEAPDFEGFWRIDKGVVNQSVQQIDSRQYTATTLETALFPTRPGEMVIAPARVVVPETVFRPRGEILSDPVTLQVQPLPDGAPIGFTGAVGHFELSAALDRQSAPLGEPITLSLTISGTGNVEQLPAPAVELPETWRAYTSPTTYSAQLMNGQVVGTKQVDLQLVPDQAGLHTLPSVTFSYFDPFSLSYQSLTSSPVTLTVLPPGAAPPPAPVIREQVDFPALKSVPAVSVTLSNLPEPGFWLLWLLPPLAVIVSAAWVRYQSHKTVRWRSQVLNRALSRLQTAQTTGSFQLVRQAIDGYLREKLRQPSRSASDLLQSLPLAPALRQQLETCLEQADEGLYAPTGSANLQSLVNQTRQVLTAVDADWKQP